MTGRNPTPKWCDCDTLAPQKIFEATVKKVGQPSIINTTVRTLALTIHDQNYKPQNETGKASCVREVNVKKLVFFTTGKNDPKSIRKNLYPGSVHMSVQQAGYKRQVLTASFSNLPKNVFKVTLHDNEGTISYADPTRHNTQSVIDLCLPWNSTTEMYIASIFIESFKVDRSEIIKENIATTTVIQKRNMNNIPKSDFKEAKQKDDLMSRMSKIDIAQPSTEAVGIAGWLGSFMGTKKPHSVIPLKALKD
ncbi:MAG: hypothetical protein QS748_02820 [Candidatus Endonucleobacter bathymodioli]|uniref:Uncharacterized protein n=1 Tax=Candidatus Endonucleibacter bathymodioli TaxID=539814 RepID=A0AA90SX08_9GAMM|nr:hypothetical protein [Candidatus Endonucleobacter bathymodioli]